MGRPCNLPPTAQMSEGLWIIVLEMLVALGLFVFIVWWTMRGRHKRDD